jgi:hypothetical protein
MIEFFLDKGYINIRLLYLRMYAANYYNVLDQKEKRASHGLKHRPGY